jgi:hypothetical protein
VPFYDLSAFAHNAYGITPQECDVMGREVDREKEEEARTGKHD